MNPNVEQARQRLVAFYDIISRCLRMYATSENRLRKKAHISPKTLSAMKSRTVSADVYLRIIIALLRIMDQRMREGKLPPDFERGIIRAILKWYDGEDAYSRR